MSSEYRRASKPLNGKTMHNSRLHKQIPCHYLINNELFVGLGQKCYCPSPAVVHINSEASKLAAKTCFLQRQLSEYIMLSRWRKKHIRTCGNINISALNDKLVGQFFSKFGSTHKLYAEKQWPGGKVEKVVGLFVSWLEMSKISLIQMKWHFGN